MTAPPNRPDVAITTDSGSPAVDPSTALPREKMPRSVDDWQLADQTWRDWRTAITAIHDEPTRQLAERAWAAGRLDGATATHTLAGNGHGPTPRMALELIEASGDQGRVNLMRLQQAVGGAGSISGPYPYATGGYCYVWRAATKDDLEKVWRTTGPFLGLAKFVDFRVAMSAPPASANGHDKKNGAKANGHHRGKAKKRNT